MIFGVFSNLMITTDVYYSPDLLLIFFWVFIWFYKFLKHQPAPIALGAQHQAAEAEGEWSHGRENQMEKGLGEGNYRVW